MILAAPIRASAQTGPQLRILQRVRRTIVAFDPVDDSILDINLEEAAATAIVRRATDANDPLNRRVLQRIDGR
jgi:hypothetical protein